MVYIARKAFTYNGVHIAQGAVWEPAGLRADAAIIKARLVVEQKEPPVAMERPRIRRGEAVR